ncbi:chorismate synthase [Ammoniphilus oxalaticus]|uniref:Chorismate synthase n=1 Tax=Ammoniphilus oxalaticus TaxID=66863 RepID=A0A419SN55_9BACL|nr:chorismate synthase [Ammoniphilus oxalaticus]RKD25707.1 chorismate synthase [Ammoniphilus oxalaticus]
MRYLTAGESHGPQLTAIIEGVPSNVPISVDKINTLLQRRQKGHGRGRRMQIETDQVRIVAGVRHGLTTGAPICLIVENKDWTHWEHIMGVEPLAEGQELQREVTKPRPGHADLNGALKYNQEDMRNILERSSARETAVRVAVAGVAQQLLEQFGIRVGSHVKRIGSVEAKEMEMPLADLIEVAEASSVRCLDPEAGQQMMDLIDKAKSEGDSLGGIVEVIAEGLPIGLGSHVQWDRKLDGRLAQAIMSIQAFKGVEIGIGFEAGARPGSEVHDEIVWDEEGGFYRSSNRAGGFEGGMTTGMPVVVRGVMKPIPTLYKPLQSVDLATKEPFEATIERSDSCAVPAAAVVAEAVVTIELAKAMIETFHSDNLEQMKQSVAQYASYLESR